MHVSVLLRVVTAILGVLAGLVLGGLTFRTFNAAGGLLVGTLAALLLFFMLLGRVFSSAQRRLEEDPDDRIRAILATMVASIAAGLCGSMVLNLWGLTQVNRFIPILVAGEQSRRIVGRAYLYVLPAAGFLVSAVVIALVDFFMAGTRFWARVRANAEDNNAFLLGLAFAVLLIALAIVSVLSNTSEFLIALALAAAGLGLLKLADRALGRSRILGVAKHMIAEGLRMKIALVFLGILLLIMPTLPFTAAGDGVTLKSRVQSFLTYSLGATGFLLSVLTVFLSCSSIAHEIRGKQIVMIATKPIPRWQFFAGKWLGIVVLDAALLLGCGVAIWGFTKYLSKQETRVIDDREALENEVLTARYTVRPHKPDMVALVDERIRQLREEGRLDNMDGSGYGTLRKQIADELNNEWRSVGPATIREYEFRNMLVQRAENEWIHIHMQPKSSVGVDDEVFVVAFQAGDPEEPETRTDPIRMEIVANRYVTVPLPARAVNSKGVLYLRFANLDPRNTIVFEGDDGFTVMYDVGTFHWNLVRAMSVIWCRLAFMAALGLLMSACFSFPVACIACFVTLFVATLFGFLSEAVEAAAPATPEQQDPLWILGPVLRPLANAFLFIVPDFSKYDPVGNVVNGQNVTLMWVITSFVELILLKGLVLAIIGSVVFTRRELAKVVV